MLGLIDLAASKEDVPTRLLPLAPTSFKPPNCFAVMRLSFGRRMSRSNRLSRVGLRANLIRTLTRA